MDSRIRRAIAFMEENLGRRLTEKELAHKAGVTAQHFCVLFRAETGETPICCLRRLRLEKARKLLHTDENSNLSIKEVAARVGYDVSHFVRDFEERFGQSPRRYKAIRVRS